MDCITQTSERCWFLEFLSAISNSIGHFIRIDHPMASMARSSVASMCVKVDLTKDLSMEIGIKLGGMH